MGRIQFLTDDRGIRQSAVVPIELFNKLVEAADLDEFYEFVSVEAGPHDNERVPGEVVSIMMDKEISLQAAWRVFRGLSQKEVAKKLNMTQAAVSKMEQSTKPQITTLEKLSTLYDCQITQLTLD
ncbi:helix-turn-helix domain-containing protein [Kalamiella sp. sgz302252]|uniref:helix-turn-helix domain-containing protein n=1 Tax=Pantoea sp. sgz302252 TaxID=3341827 RepID=UPI0036D36EEC